MRRARREDLILALLSLFAATGEGGVCADIIDTAIEAASEESASTLRGVGIAEPTAARFGATRVINSLCSACAACGRGRGEEAEALTTDHSRRPA